MGGRTFGIARGATVIAVKVLRCSGIGTTAGVISGVQWAGENARRRQRRSVANLSLGGFSPALNLAVASVVDAGVTLAVAAGNEDQNACNTSPASEPKAIAVGATYYYGNYTQDTRASFSVHPASPVLLTYATWLTKNSIFNYVQNWGTCVDILAPGQSIRSAWIGSNSAYNTISGTSMASPHVCGVAALVYGANPSFSAEAVKQQILQDSTAGVVELGCGKSGCSSTPNKMLYSARC